MPTDANPNPLGTVHAQGVLGLNSIIVYGENLQVAVGLNHQLALGSNLQLCINPAGLLANVPSIPGIGFFTPILGSGIGGNMQLTIGTSANVVYGREFDINLGPTKIELGAGKDGDAASYILCGLLGAATLVFVIAYGITTGDADRAKQTLVFQAVVDALLGGLMLLEMHKKQADDKMEKARQEFYDAADKVWDTAMAAPTSDEAFGPTLLTTVAILGAAVAPLLAVKDEIGH